MSHFTKALNDYLAGPPPIRQRDFANKIDMRETRLSRILLGHLGVNRDALDMVLSGVPNAEDKRRLAQAYLRDVMSPSVIALLQSKEGKSDFAHAEISKLSRKGEAALKALIESPHREGIERLLVELVKTFSVR